MYNGSIDVLRAASKKTGIPLIAPGETPSGGQLFQYYDGKIGDVGLLEHILKTHKPEQFIDLASMIEAGGSMAGPELYVLNNVVQTYYFFKTAFAHGVKRGLVSGTATVFGKLDPGTTGFTEDVNRARKDSSDLDPATTQIGKFGGEKLHQYLLAIVKYELSHDSTFCKYLDNIELQSRLRYPTSIYGWTKVMKEVMIEYFAKQNNAMWCVLRYMNLWGGDPEFPEIHGINIDKNDSHLLPNGFDRLLEFRRRKDIHDRRLLPTEYLPLNGMDWEGTSHHTTERDYIYLGDVIPPHLNLEMQGIFNFGTDVPVGTILGMRSIAEIGEANLILLSKDDYTADPETPGGIILNKDVDPNALYVRICSRRDGDAMRAYANAKKIREKYGFIANVVPLTEQFFPNDAIERKYGANRVAAFAANQRALVDLLNSREAVFERYCQSKR